MSPSNSVSRRTAAIYSRYYEDREAQRAENLYLLFVDFANAVESAGEVVSLQMDYARLGELVRSYFLDVIRYKEYHFGPDPKHEDYDELKSKLRIASLDDLDPLSEKWTELVHTTANINQSKVAAYTVKWILTYKPISVVSSQASMEPAKLSYLISSINEFYALSCALYALELRADAISPRKLDELIYSFRFRKYDEAAFFMILTRDYLLASPEA